MTVLDDLGLDLANIPEFKACSYYEETLDRLVILLEDVTYVTFPVIPGSVDVFIHPGEGKVVGCQIWCFSRYPHAKEILKMVI